MKHFQIPAPTTSTSKSARFPAEVVEAIRGRACTFSAFVAAAVRSALEDLAGRDT